MFYTPGMEPTLAEITSISKAFRLLDTRMFEEPGLNLDDKYSGGDRGNMHSVRLNFGEIADAGIDPEVFRVSGNQLSAYSVLLKEVLLNRGIPASFVTDMQYGRNFRVNIDAEGITFLVSENNIVKPLERLAGGHNAPKAIRLSQEAIQNIYNGALDYKMADRQYGKGWTDRVEQPSASSPMQRH